MDRTHISNFLGIGWGNEGGHVRRVISNPEWIFEDNYMFIIFNVVIISYVFTDITIYQIVPLHIFSVLYANNTLIKLFKKEILEICKLRVKFRKNK